MTLQALTDEIRNKVTQADTINATAKIITDQGVVYIDGTKTPSVVSNEDKPADCDLQISVDNLVKLGTGAMNPMMAMMTGKLKIDGNMGVAMKMGKIMG